MGGVRGEVVVVVVVACPPQARIQLTLGSCRRPRPWSFPSVLLAYGVRVRGAGWEEGGDWLPVRKPQTRTGVWRYYGSDIGRTENPCTYMHRGAFMNYHSPDPKHVDDLERGRRGIGAPQNTWCRYACVARLCDSIPMFAALISYAKTCRDASRLASTHPFPWNRVMHACREETSAQVHPYLQVIYLNSDAHTWVTGRSGMAGT